MALHALSDVRGTAFNPSKRANRSAAAVRGAEERVPQLAFGLRNALPLSLLLWALLLAPLLL